jgi:thiopeptide-type bacteriocin biosynthesis protein
MQTFDTYTSFLNPIKRKADWISIYIYTGFVQPTARPGIVRQVMQDVSKVVGAAVPFFYVSYADKIGSHLRLRILSSTTLRRRRIMKTVCSLGEANGTRYQSYRVRVVNYRPEYRRYGGSMHIAISEAFFCISSRWIVLNLDKLLVSYSKCIVCAAICMTIIVNLAFPNLSERRSFLLGFRNNLFTPRTNPQDSSYRESLAVSAEAGWKHDRSGWISAIRQGESAASGTASSAAPFAEWASSASAFLAALKASYAHSCDNDSIAQWRILSSVMHMHNNRLGLRNCDEALICFCLYEYERDRIVEG